MRHLDIPGYDFGTAAVPHTPISMAEFELMKKTALFGDDDVRYLRMSRGVLADQVDAVLDVWYGFVAANPHLMRSFVNRHDGRPDERYLAAVRRRFGQWVLDTADAEYGRAWLDWQIEIGRRHHRCGKNLTDRAESTDLVPFRYLVPLTYAILATLRPFLAAKGHPPAEVAAMHQAWTKSVLLQVTLWSYPYVRDGDF